MIAWLFDTLLYTGLIIALVLVLRRPVARHFGAQTAYMLWALPFLRLLMPPIVLPASLAPKAEAFSHVAAAPDMLAADQVGAVAVQTIADTAPAAGGAAGWGLIDLASGFIVPVWLAGAATFLVWRFVSYRRMREDLLADARPVGDVGKIRLVETPMVAAPVAFGVGDKVVAMPQFFMAQRDLASRDLAIAHELAHHRGNDLLANFAAQALLALHWFNPLAWMGWRAMRRDQEAACDARVLSGRCSEDRARYAALIANVAIGPRLALAAPMACPVLGEKSIIHRLRSLSQTETTRRQRILGRTLVAAGALALPLTASISYAAVDEEEESPAASRSQHIVVVDDRAGDHDQKPLFTNVVKQDDGTTVVLKTNRELSDAEVKERVDQAIADMPSPPPAPPSTPSAPSPYAPVMLSAPTAPSAPSAPTPYAVPSPRAAVQSRQIVIAPRTVSNPRVTWQKDEYFDAKSFERDMQQMEADLENAFRDNNRWAADSARMTAQAQKSAKAAQARAALDCVDEDEDDDDRAARSRVTCQQVAMRAALTGLRSARAAIAASGIPARARAEALSEIDSEIEDLMDEI